jgi:NodT family efflux transporter outer membrane factor (OMF) lipoprotein
MDAGFLGQDPPAGRKRRGGGAGERGRPGERQLSAQATLATDYINLRYEDSLQHLLTETVAAYQRALEITQNQYAAGTVSSADVVTAQAQLQTTQAQLIAVGVLRGQYEHAIAILTGHPPADLTIPVTALPQDVPVVPAGIPSSCWSADPTLPARNGTMDQQNALIGVAISAYYPDITLSALFGFAGNPLSQLFSTANRVWSLGAAASDTIFDGGARSAAVDIARDTYDQSVATYRQAVLTAFQQVEDQLVALRVLAQQAAAEDVAVASAQQAVSCDDERVPRGHGCVYECHYRADAAAGRPADRFGDPAEPAGRQRDAGRGTGRRLGNG